MMFLLFQLVNMFSGLPVLYNVQANGVLLASRDVRMVANHLAVLCNKVELQLDFWKYLIV